MIMPRDQDTKRARLPDAAGAPDAGGEPQLQSRAAVVAASVPICTRDCGALEGTVAAVRHHVAVVVAIALVPEHGFRAIAEAAPLRPGISRPPRSRYDTLAT